MNPEEVKKLLDNGWQVLIFKDGLGSYSALAVCGSESVDDALADWRNYEEDTSEPMETWFLQGPNRYCGCGHSVAEALAAVTEKVLFGRLPKKD